MARSLGELAVECGCELVGDPAKLVSRVATLANATPDSLSFLANKAYRAQLASTTAGAVVLQPEHAELCPVAALIHADPYLAYARIAATLHPDPEIEPGIHPAACVDPAADVDSGAQVSANATVEAGAIVEGGAFIGPGAVVGPGCRVGRDSRLLANSTLVRDVTLGKRCIVHPGAVIGSDGFGNAMGESGWIKVPQVGGVRIGDDVEIGSNSTIDRGAIDDTVIEDGVRIDNLVQIAHNVRIGAHTALAAMAGVSGSTVIGKRCMLAGQAGIVGHIRICDDVVVGGATMISKDIVEPGFYTGSFPAEKDREWKRKVARFRRLGELQDRVKSLEARAKKNDD